MAKSLAIKSAALKMSRGGVRCREKLETPARLAATLWNSVFRVKKWLLYKQIRDIGGKSYKKSFSPDAILKILPTAGPSFGKIFN